MPQRCPTPFFSKARKMCRVLPPPSQVPTSITVSGFFGASVIASVSKCRSTSDNCPATSLINQMQHAWPQSVPTAMACKKKLYSSTRGFYHKEKTSPSRACDRFRFEPLTHSFSDAMVGAARFFSPGTISTRQRKATGSLFSWVPTSRWPSQNVLSGYGRARGNDFSGTRLLG